MLMPNIASVLKAEVSRVARKELRSETEGLKKAVAAHRAELSALRRRLADTEKVLRALVKSAAATKPVANEPETAGRSPRFSAKGLASNRKRLGLSAADFGLLVGTTGQSIYGWEQGKSVPRAANLAAVAELRGLGKKEVASRLAALKAK